MLIVSEILQKTDFNYWENDINLFISLTQTTIEITFSLHKFDLNASFTQKIFFLFFILQKT